MTTPKLYFLTIVCNGMPWITRHYAELSKLSHRWEWHIVEGQSAPGGDTNCQILDPGLSADGTSEYLDALAYDPRIKIHRNPWWIGKLEMLNTALWHMHEEGLLWEIDCDELWTADQIERVAELFAQHPDRNAAMFYCRYWIGPDIQITTTDTYGNYTHYEWLRVWRYTPYTKFQKHEPPKLGTRKPAVLTHEETKAVGAVFDHCAYVTEDQVAFKERFYGYKDAVSHWKRLQLNTKWPTKVSKWLPWVTDQAEATRV